MVERDGNRELCPVREFTMALPVPGLQMRSGWRTWGNGRRQSLSTLGGLKRKKLRALRGRQSASCS
jgi:hypothetical protein